MVTAWFPSPSAGILGGHDDLVRSGSTITRPSTSRCNCSGSPKDRRRRRCWAGWLRPWARVPRFVSYAASGGNLGCVQPFSYNGLVYMGSRAGSPCVLIALYCWAGLSPQFEAPEPQIKKMVLPAERYWLYYALQFMSGARRQIFLVFAAFMMVERFGFEVHEVTALFLINFVANMIFAPLHGPRWWPDIGASGTCAGLRIYRADLSYSWPMAVSIGLRLGGGSGG